MDVETQHCLAVVTNVDDSVLTLALPDGFRFHARHADYLAPLLAKLEFLAEHEVRARLKGKYRCISSADVIFTIEGMVQLPRVSCPRSSDNDQTLRLAEQRAVERVDRYVELLQLFKDSSVDLVLIYLFRGTHENPEYTLSQSITSFAERSDEGGLFSITEADTEPLREFFTRSILPFNHAYLQLAYENFSQSYRVDRNHLKFLSLMIAMEVLFNDAAQELRYRVSRGVAALLATDRESGEQLFRSMKKLYDVRSKLVHTGSAPEFTFASIRELRSLVRRSLLVIGLMNISKDQLSQRLTASGFGAPSAAT